MSFHQDMDDFLPPVCPQYKHNSVFHHHSQSCLQWASCNSRLQFRFCYPDLGFCGVFSLVSCDSFSSSSLGSCGRTYVFPSSYGSKKSCWHLGLFSFSLAGRTEWWLLRSLHVKPERKSVVFYCRVFFCSLFLYVFFLSSHVNCILWKRRDHVES